MKKHREQRQHLHFVKVRSVLHFSVRATVNVRFEHIPETGKWRTRKKVARNVFEPHIHGNRHTKMKVFKF